MDRLTKERRSWLMARVGGRDTGPERVVRGFVRALGIRPRLNDPRLPGKPDLAFPSAKKAIFVHGCFWHRHPNCPKATMPKTRRAFWRAKFDANVARDRRVRRALRAMGWRTMVVWQCRLARPDAAARRIANFLGR
jgi:DNA mismatch endonuclease (patch repair protein)